MNARVSPEDTIELKDHHLDDVLKDRWKQLALQCKLRFFPKSQIEVDLGVSVLVKGEPPTRLSG